MKIFLRFNAKPWNLQKYMCEFCLLVAFSLSVPIVGGGEGRERGRGKDEM